MPSADNSTDYVEIEEIEDIWGEDDPDIQYAKEKTKDDLYLLFVLAALYAMQAYRLTISTDEIRNLAEDFANKRADEMLASIRMTASEFLKRLVNMGMTREEIAKFLADTFLLSQGHVDLIALEAFIRGRNMGQGTAMKLGGVKMVKISDGLDFDQPCIEADGQTWTIDQYLDNPLEHPNCQRQAHPIGR